jgi:phosphomevalonate kinase
LTTRKQLHHPEGRRREIVLVSDCRRPTDIDFFRHHFPGHVLCIRLKCPIEVRQQRGFVHREGIDDAQSECALDNFTNWDFFVCNDGQRDLDNELARIVEYLKSTYSIFM